MTNITTALEGIHKNLHNNMGAQYPSTTPLKVKQQQTAIKFQDEKLEKTHNVSIKCKQHSKLCK